MQVSSCFQMIPQPPTAWAGLLTRLPKAQTSSNMRSLPFARRSPYPFLKPGEFFMRHWLALFIAVSSTVCAAAQELAPNKALHALFEREFQLRLVESPESATFLGIDTFNDRLSDFSPEATARRKAHVKAAIIELRKFDARKLSTQDRISREIMLDGLMRKDEENRLYG